jgi:hypothetical protein
VGKGRLDQPPKRVDEKAIKALSKAGCGKEALDLIVAETCGGDDPAKKLYELATFAKTIGAPAAKDYFRAIAETGAVAELTDQKVLNFATSVDNHTAEWYFWAIWGTKKVTELTDERVLRSADFFKTIDSQATVEYFLAIRETKAAAELTEDRVVNFARSIGSEAAADYFGALWETQAVPALTSDRILNFATSLGNDAARDYFRAIRETKSAAELTEQRVLEFAKVIGKDAAGDCFRAVRNTKAVKELTNDNVFVFAESIGKKAAREYFRVIERTKAVAQLTAESVLDTSGVVRSIGSDAAVDYFLAIADMGAVSAATAVGEQGAVPTHEDAIQVLSTVDIPTYNGQRAVGLLGMSVFFWFAMWQYANLTIGASQGLIIIVVAIAAWAAVLYVGNMVLGTIAERSVDQFVERRRRLLNEHGIPWHDCLAGDQKCRYCWSEGHHHNDDRYDYGRFCRCLACRY